MKLEEDAKHSFNFGFNCAESVSLTVTKHLGLGAGGSGSFIPRVATGFGGGIARNGDVCGALIGGIVAINLILGRNYSDQSRDSCYDAVDSFYNDFVKAFGASQCSKIIGLDLKEPRGRELYERRAHYEQCNPIVAWAAKRAYEIIRKSQRTGPPVLLNNMGKPEC